MTTTRRPSTLPDLRAVVKAHVRPLPTTTTVRRSHHRAMCCMGCPATIPAGAMHLVALTPVGSGIVLDAHYCGGACRRRAIGGAL